MNYFEAPNYYRPSPAPKLFLAGGITGCPDWQSEAVKGLRKLAMSWDLIIFNPRRVEFPMGDREAAEAQIIWEFHHLRAADVILFWFPADQIQPIALYELGAWSMSDKPIVIGCDAAYPRRQDVVIQTELIRPEVIVMPTLDLTIGQALIALSTYGLKSI